MSNTEHRLKINPQSYNAIITGTKTAEFRLNDRNFKVGDVLDLSEYLAESDFFTGDYVKMTISHIQTGYGIPEGYVMLSFAGCDCA